MPNDDCPHFEPHLTAHFAALSRRRTMRKQHQDTQHGHIQHSHEHQPRTAATRCKALLGALSLSAGLLAGTTLGTATPAQAWSRWDEPPTAENLEALRWCESTNDYTT